MKSLAALGFFLILSSTALAKDRRYIGAERCKSCHEKAYATWLASSHARAGGAIPDNRKGELGCLFCHATDVAANLREYKHSNVQCEACHGPGQIHVELASIPRAADAPKPGGLEKVTEVRCRGCHTSEGSVLLRPFDFAQAREAIRHW